MEKFRLILKVLIVLILLPVNSHSKTFTSQYVEFELPSGWDCALEGSEWVCQAEDKDRKKEAIIILAAKYRGEQDSYEAYQSYLKQPKTFSLPGGKTQISEAKSVQIKELNNHRWIDALHLASEVPGFYTRYLATVKDTLGIAVTFSVGKDHYDSYLDVFEKIISTLKVFDQKFAENKNWVKKNNEGNIVDGTTVIGDTTSNPDIGRQKNQQDDGSAATTQSILAFILIAIVGGFIYKMKQKKKK